MKSIEKRASGAVGTPSTSKNQALADDASCKNNSSLYTQQDYSSRNGQGTMSHAQILRQQKSATKTTYNTPKKVINPVKEKYQDFTVRFGIVKPEDTDLDMSPSA